MSTLHRRSARLATVALALLGASASLLAGPTAEKPLRPTTPKGWKLEKTISVPEANLDAFSKKLGGTIVALTNYIYATETGEAIRVNVARCTSDADAARVADTMRRFHGGFRPSVLARGRNAVELVSKDAATVLTAPYLLRLEPRKRIYHVTLAVAPLSAGDWTSYNRLFNLFLTLDAHPDDSTAKKSIDALRKRFAFADHLTVRRYGVGDAKIVWTASPPATQQSPLPGIGALRLTFPPLPRIEGVPKIVLHATVPSTFLGVTRTDRKPGPELLRATPSWPVDDPRIVALAKKITAGDETGTEKVKDLLAWFRPGGHLRYAGSETGSRYGVKKVIDQGYGHCWDFSDVFITLARAAGVPARQVSGWLYGVSGHVWPEVLLNDAKGRFWRQVDPTSGIGCTTDYVPLFVSEDGAMPAIYLSMPKIEIAGD